MNAMFERWAQRCEGRNRGWIVPREVPPCTVTIDGKEVKHVAAVHRKTGRVKVYKEPFQLDRYKKRLLMMTARGRQISLTPMG